MSRGERLGLLLGIAAEVALAIAWHMFPDAHWLPIVMALLLVGVLGLALREWLRPAPGPAVGDSSLAQGVDSWAGQLRGEHARIRAVHAIDGALRSGEIVAWGRQNGGPLVAVPADFWRDAGLELESTVQPGGAPRTEAKTAAGERTKQYFDLHLNAAQLKRALRRRRWF
jgi:hypothetical protein